MKKRNNLILVLILVAGIIFVLISVIIFAEVTKFKHNGVKTQAVITEIRSYYVNDETEYDVFVEFDVDGTTYSGKLNAYEIGFHEGKEIPIYYMEDNPNDFIYGKRNYFISVIFFLAGVFLLVISVGKIAINLIRKIKIKRIKENGTHVSATVRRIEKNSKVKLLNGFYVTVSCIDDFGRLFEKKIVMQDNLIKEGDIVDLYYDVENPDKFEIDFENLRERMV